MRAGFGFSAIWVAQLLIATWLASTASAALIVYDTDDGAMTGGKPVDARATFTTAANQITVVLQNLQANPTSIVQNLSGLTFTVSSGEDLGTIFSGTGMERSVAGNKTYSNGPTVAAGWSLTTVGDSLKLNLLGSKPAAPSHTLLGPPASNNKYNSANGSIKANGPHNPFMAESITWVLNVPGVTPASSISAVIFHFNTAAGNNVAAIPEPAGALLLLSGLALAFIRR